MLGRHFQRTRPANRLNQNAHIRIARHNRRTAFAAFENCVEAIQAQPAGLALRMARVAVIVEDRLNLLRVILGRSRRRIGRLLRKYSTGEQHGDNGRDRSRSA